MAAASSPQDIIEQTVQEPDYSGIQTINLKLRELFKDREGKLPTINPKILKIHNKTNRIVKNQITKEFQFYNNRGKFVREGKLYHIHYTTDMKQYYMTGAEHNASSTLIYLADLREDDFSYYNLLNKQRVLTIKSTSPVPTEEDYTKGSFTRYFAKKSNDTSTPVFEISETDFRSSALYTYVSLAWYIRGDKSLVLLANNRQIAIASKVIPNVGKLLSNYQYFRFMENLSPVELVKERLGITGEQGTTQETTQQTSSNSTAGSFSAGSAGPPPGYTPVG